MQFDLWLEKSRGELEVEEGGGMLNVPQSVEGGIPGRWNRRFIRGKKEWSAYMPRPNLRVEQGSSVGYLITFVLVCPCPVSQCPRLFPPDKSWLLPLSLASLGRHTTTARERSISHVVSSYSLHTTYYTLMRSSSSSSFSHSPSSSLC